MFLSLFCLITEQQINVAKKPEAVQKKARAVAKPPQTHEVIVISPDTNEVAKAKHDAASSKKKVTYTSVLNARSKVVRFLFEFFKNRHLKYSFFFID